MNNADFQTFLDSYLECLFWSTTNWEDDTNFDETHEFEDLSSESMGEITAECWAFFDDNQHMFEGLESQAGHDFCLTRNGHGAGFWDRPDMYGQENASKLAELCAPYGTQGLYVGDDDQLWTHG